MTISTIIVTYNATKNNWIEKCLYSLSNSTIKTEIIVVDNASSDDTCAIIKSKFPEVILIESDTNLGFGAANNLGLKKALDLGKQKKEEEEYFFLLNQDAYIDSDAIEKLVSVSRKNPEYGIISPLHMNGAGTALDYNFSTSISPSQCKNLYSDAILSQVKDKVYEAEFACAAAWLLTKECLEKVGGFNPTFFHYGEDDNYAHRLHYKGLKLGIYPFAKIYHDREDRPKSKYESWKELNKKFLLKDASNPLSKFNISQHLTSLKRKKILALITFNSKHAQELSQIIKFIEDNIDTIQKNKNITTSEQKYIFL